MDNTQRKKIATLVLFLVLFLGGAFMMNYFFLRNKQAVDPTTVPHRTKQNPFLVDSLKKAGYYDTFQMK